MRCLLLLLFFIAVYATAAPPPEYKVEVVHVYPHDRSAFTQGLEYHDGKLYESTGLEGRSSVRIVNLPTGAIVRHVNVPPPFFGEGITVLRGRIVELTWTSKVGFVYRQSDLNRIGEFHYLGEGWGLTNDGARIYFSDGTSTMRVLNGQSLLPERRFTVHDGNQEVTQLNELEWVRGELWANVWQTDRIARISPQDGTVIGWIDASGLLPPDRTGLPVDVLNGIAYDSARNRIFLTGKLWPSIFEVRVVPKSRR